MLCKTVHDKLLLLAPEAALVTSERLLMWLASRAVSVVNTYKVSPYLNLAEV